MTKDAKLSLFLAFGAGALVVGSCAALRGQDGQTITVGHTGKNGKLECSWTEAPPVPVAPVAPVAGERPGPNPLPRPLPKPADVLRDAGPDATIVNGSPVGMLLW